MNISSNFTLTNNGTISGDGFIYGDLSNSVDGRISVRTGDRLQMQGFSGGANLGAIDVVGGEFDVTSATTNAQGAILTARNGTVRFQNGLTNNGSIGISFGTIDVFGDVNNTSTGSIVVTGNSEATFYDDLINNGEFRVRSGSTAVVFGDFSGANGVTGGGDLFLEGDLRPGNSPGLVSFESDVFLSFSSTSEFELGGLQIGTEYDSIIVDGLLVLNGTLDVRNYNGFTAKAGDSFELIQANTLTGNFSRMLLPELAAGLTWKPTQNFNSFRLLVAVPEPSLLGFAGLIGLHFTTRRRRSSHINNQRRRSLV